MDRMELNDDIRGRETASQGLSVLPHVVSAGPNAGLLRLRLIIARACSASIREFTNGQCPELHQMRRAAGECDLSAFHKCRHDALQPFYLAVLGIRYRRVAVRIAATRMCWSEIRMFEPKSLQWPYDPFRILLSQRDAETVFGGSNELNCRGT